MTEAADDSSERIWQALSAFCDGEAGAHEADHSVGAWRDQATLRERWHAYQWIGDVMRSDDLASAVEHDQAFLATLRARLVQEPVVLAPSRAEAFPRMTQAQAPLLVAGRGSRRVRWAAPAAVAAGFMVVTGALVVMRGGNVPEAAAPMAISPSPVIQATDGDAAMATAAVGPGGEMIRSAELDRYLNAHRQYAQGPALATPGGVRQVAVTPEGR
jgi:sigma-E factor negative regulatory protein RseA